MTSAAYSPEIFPVVAPPGWKVTLPAKKSNGQSCSNDAGGDYTSGGKTYPPERPILWDGYDATRTDIDGEAVPHRAMDIMAATGAPIVADAPGTVFETWNYRGSAMPGVGTSSRGGNYVWIKGDDGVDRYYSHLHEPSRLTPGQRVQTGDLVGLVGDTGNAKGGCPHLHYATEINGTKFNPFPQLKALYDAGTWNGFTPNGWNGLSIGIPANTGTLFGALLLAGLGAIGLAIYYARRKS